MKAFMTTGSYELLKKIAEKHRNLQFIYMQGTGGTLAYYEDEGNSVFSSGRDFEILLTKGEIKKEGFVAMNNIPVMEEGQPVFEEQFRQRQENIESAAGFQAFRLLKPCSGHTYIVLTQWNSAKDFEDWKASPQFKAAHDKQIIKKTRLFC
ncbi:antibiotic biosynthesis monooxygenase [Virgibacillus halophilus]|uniref:Antibiotic biosynthesis monooxygenase n=1 Tax=Tigheibacillus halophilus TaxID=361280 RepID=A0ABU5C9L5_9BACI|nr:antibiotic biosynthesis monooxygenase [Virgibacillus halophilus]